MENGNFVEQMFIYKRLREKDNTIQKYGGIHEVVCGDFSQNRQEKKYETHIEKVLDWPIRNRESRDLSHFSLQGFCTYLKKQGRSIRSDELDDRYYPFVLEFESNNIKEQFDVAYEAAAYYQELINEYHVNEKDIVTIITPSKSIYIWVNPKVFGLVMGKNIHRIYTEMYKTFKKDLGLKYVDESVVNSSYRLIKTPGSYYKNGYVNHITVKELLHLMTGEKTREDLTKDQRDIRELYLPGIQSLKLSNLYKKCSEKVNKPIKKHDRKEVKELKLPGNEEVTKACVKALIDIPLIEKGNRNNFLVTIALGLIQENYSEDEIISVLKDKAMEWKHDESLNAVVSKYKSLVRNKTKFSCDKVKMLFEEEGLTFKCSACNQSINSIFIARSVIENIYKNKGSVRHFKAYLELEKNQLLGRFFSLDEVNINIRTLNELGKLTNGKLEKKNNGLYKLTVKRGRAIYRLPLDYLDTADILDQKLGKILMLIVKSYSENEYGAFVSLSIIKMAQYLGFKNERSIYTLLNELEKLGFLTKNKKGITVYYRCRKIINLEKKKEERRERLEVIEELKVVNGTQIKFEFEKTNNKVITPGTNFENNEIHIGKNIRNFMGSPPRPPS